MPFHRHLECNSSEDAEQLEAGTIEDAHGSDSAPMSTPCSHRCHPRLIWTALRMGPSMR